MVFFGLKTWFKKIFQGYFCPRIKIMWKIWVKIASELVFKGAGRICTPCHLGCISDAASWRVKLYPFYYPNMWLDELTMAWPFHKGMALVAKFVDIWDDTINTIYGCEVNPTRRWRVLKPPPPIQCPLQRPLLVGLK